MKHLHLPFYKEQNQFTNAKLPKDILKKFRKVGRVFFKWVVLELK